jgi:hypothetical protein
MFLMSSRGFLLIISLMLQSVLPLMGVLFLGWDWREIIVFYWFANITNGAVTVIDMLRTKGIDPTVVTPIGMSPGLSVSLAKLFRTIFFCIHYGGFTAIHGFFVFIIVDGEFPLLGSDGGDISYGVIIVAWALSFVSTVLIKLFSRQRPTADPGKIMGRAYGRIMALHFAILLGAYVVAILDLASGAAVLLIVLNFLVDIVSYKRQPQVQ